MLITQTVGLFRDDDEEGALRPIVMFLIGLRGAAAAKVVGPRGSKAGLVVSLKLRVVVEGVTSCQNQEFAIGNVVQ